MRLIQPGADIEITSARLYIFDDTLTSEQRERVARYLINAVENREKDMSRLALPEPGPETPVGAIEGFSAMTREDADALRVSMGLAMSTDDLMEAVKYFASEGRDPQEAEIRILDTYWRDHWHDMRHELGRDEKPLHLMDHATIGARWLKANGKLQDLEQSEENNACSIYVDLDVDGETERWLLQFKNETHTDPPAAPSFTRQCASPAPATSTPPWPTRCPASCRSASSQRLPQQDIPATATR